MWVSKMRRNSRSRSMGTPKPPDRRLKPRRTVVSMESGLWAVTQMGGVGFCTGWGNTVVSGILKYLPS